VITQISRDDLSLLERAVRHFCGVEEADVVRAFAETPIALAFVAADEAEILGWCWGHHLARPDSSSMRGASGTFTSQHTSTIKSAPLIRPSASTHVTDVDQRSIALDLKKTKDSITVTVPKNRNLVGSGWYMLFVTDDQGTPSKAQWVKVP